MKKTSVLISVLCAFLFGACTNSEKQQKLEQQRLDSIVNAKVEKAKAELEEKVRQEQEAKEREAKAAMEAVRPSGNSLREREMRFYYDQGYDFGSHPSFSKMDDAWMRKAFLYVVSQHDMSHAGNQNLLNSFMAGVAQGRAELKDLQN